MKVFECAGLLPGSTAKAITDHVKETRKRGKSRDSFKSAPVSFKSAFDY